MTRSARIEQRRQAHYQEPAPSSAEPDDGIDFARLKIEPRYLPALDGTQPYHRAPEAGRAAPISERRVAELVAEALLVLCVRDVHRISPGWSVRRVGGPDVAVRSNTRRSRADGEL